MGETTAAPGLLPFAVITQRSGNEVEVHDGAVSADGRVFGTYLHGVFDNCHFRRPFLNRIREEKGLAPAGGNSRRRRTPSTCWRTIWMQHLDMERLFDLCGLAGRS